MKNICVFCGSAVGHDAKYKEATEVLGRLIASKHMRLIYGAGSVGLMGILADTVMAHGGEVVGVIPDFLIKKEVGHAELSELVVVNTMHERKQKMAELADAFIALPGGMGTMEELAEILTWVQLELIKKPVGVLNVDGFFSFLQAQLDHMVAEGFLKVQNRNRLLEATDPAQLLDQILTYEFDDYSLWADLSKS